MLPLCSLIFALFFFYFSMRFRKHLSIGNASAFSKPGKYIYRGLYFQFSIGCFRLATGIGSSQWLCCSMQVCVGVLLLVVGGLDINRQRDQRPAVILNDVTLIMVFIISLINVVVSAFGMEHSGTRLREVSPPPKWSIGWTTSSFSAPMST
jgi:hypothetical protein